MGAHRTPRLIANFNDGTNDATEAEIRLGDVWRTHVTPATRALLLRTWIGLLMDELLVAENELTMDTGKVTYDG